MSSGIQAIGLELACHRQAFVPNCQSTRINADHPGKGAIMKILLLSILVWLAPLAAAAQARTICTIVLPAAGVLPTAGVLPAAGGAPLIEEGDCDRQATPASTFKIAISLMGFDAGLLQSADAPRWPFKPHYGGMRPETRRATTPQSWMRHSVIWYSQQVTRNLGPERFAAYVQAFDYGNRDAGGDPGAGNGLTRAWLSSSLQISPRQQAFFMQKLVTGELPVSRAAVTKTAGIMEYGLQPGGWTVFGKTGTGFAQNPDGSLNRDRAYGWFVGWAERHQEVVCFARLIRDDRRQTRPAGPRARDALLADLFSANGAL